MIRFYNGRVLENGAVTENEVWIKGGDIVYVGPGKEEMPAFEREIDLQGNLLMPGFKNAHTHSAMTFLRSMADDLPLQEWLFQQVFPREAKLNPKRVADFTKVAFLEYIANGITSCFDMYFHTDEFARVATEWGFRAVICDSLTAGNDWDDIYRNYEKYNRWSDTVSYLPGFHAEYTGSVDMMKHIARAAQELKAPVFSHNSETRSEVDECIARHGMTPTKLMDELGLFQYGGGGFHCVHMTEEDIEIFRNRGLYAVLNPCSNAKLASGIAPLRRYMTAGVNLAIGTDGPASNNALDFFREMYLANVLAKLSEKDAAAGDPALVLRAAVSGGAHAMGLHDCDDIAPGKKADVIVIDMHRPNMQPVHNVVKNLVYSGNPGNVKMTVVGGKVLYENGVFHVGEDVETVYAEAQKETELLLREC